MKKLIEFFSPFLLASVFVWSIKVTNAVINYKLTSIMMDSTGKLSLWVGKRQASTDIYTDWCDNSMAPFFDVDMNHVWNRSMIPFITWEITLCNHTNEDDPGIAIRINNSTYDPYINRFADRLKQWLAGPDMIYGTDDDRRAFLRLGTQFAEIASSDRKKRILHLS